MLVALRGERDSSYFSGLFRLGIAWSSSISEQTMSSSQISLRAIAKVSGVLLPACPICTQHLDPFSNPTGWAVRCAKCQSPLRVQWESVVVCALLLMAVGKWLLPDLDKDPFKNFLTFIPLLAAFLIARRLMRFESMVKPNAAQLKHIKLGVADPFRAIWVVLFGFYLGLFISYSVKFLYTDNYPQEIGRAHV